MLSSFLVVLAVVSAAGCVGSLCTAVREKEESGGEIRLIVQGDDMGCAHAVNEAFIKCYREGILRTAEVMVPCPWFEEAVKLLDENPGIDVGIHLTLTSEWDNIKWRPLTYAPSLVNDDGYFYQMTRQDGGELLPPNSGFLDANPDLEEVERELRAQIELAMRKIKNVTHVSPHMGAAVATPELQELTLRLAKEYGLPNTWPADNPDLVDYGVKLISDIEMGWWDDPAEKRIAILTETLENLTPGVYLLVEHPGLDTPEMRAISHPGYEHVPEHRSGVTRLFTSPKIKETIRKRGIKIITYADLRM
jgi:predicted glycoside hydrolase/deacetylase ChbG (UPF0249 family)